MHPSIPMELFKYMRPDAAIATLSNQNLKFSRPSLFNDEFDLRINLSVSVEVETAVPRILTQMWENMCDPTTVTADNRFGEAIRLAREIFPVPHPDRRSNFDRFMTPTILQQIAASDGMMKVLSDQLGEAAARYKVLCLSADGINPPMWAHYAADLTGVALQFTPVEELDNLSAAMPVQYETDVRPFFDTDGFVNWISGRASLPHERLRDQFLYTKLEQWRYEREWRVVAGFGFQQELEVEFLPFDRRELVAVVLGTRVTPDFRVRIMSQVAERYPETRIRQLRRSNTGNALEIAEV